MKAHSSNYSGRKVYLKDRIASFRYAFRGLSLLIISEPNAQIHVVALIIILVAGLLLKISTTGWIAILFAAGMVVAGECFNTAIEYLSDLVSPEYNEKIKKIKDISAAGVLISVIVSIIIGLIVFIPAIVKIL